MAEINETPQTPENADSANQSEQPINAEQPEISKDARMWAMFCHLAGLCGFVLPGVGNIVGPLIVWQIKKDEYPFVDQQGKEAVNFQISMTLYAIVSAALTPVFCVGFFLLAAVGIVYLVFLLIAAVKANNSQAYRYPLTIRFIK